MAHLSYQRTRFGYATRPLEPLTRQFAHLYVTSKSDRNQEHDPPRLRVKAAALNRDQARESVGHQAQPPFRAKSRQSKFVGICLMAAATLAPFTPADLAFIDAEADSAPPLAPSIVARLTDLFRGAK